MYNEIWKDVPLYDGIYQVSNTGRVRSTDRYYLRKLNKNKTLIKGKILKPFKSTRGGYLIVTFNYNKKEIRNKKESVHRLVARLFIGKCEEGMVVNHIDSNVENNNSNNLEYVTQAENINHSMKNISNRHKHNQTRVSEEVIGEIISMYVNGFSCNEIFRKTDISIRTIKAFVRMERRVKAIKNTGLVERLINERKRRGDL